MVLLDRKREMLLELIELAKLRGVTQDEYEEFNKNFDNFDRNQSGDIDSKV